LGQVPLVQGIREGGDSGLPAILGDDAQTKEAFMKIAENTLRQIAIRNESIEATEIVQMKE
jgi:ATP-binding protein involved in chromosome partitioning